METSAADQASVMPTAAWEPLRWLRSQDWLIMTSRVGSILSDGRHTSFLSQTRGVTSTYLAHGSIYGDAYMESLLLEKVINRSIISLPHVANRKRGEEAPLYGPNWLDSLTHIWQNVSLDIAGCWNMDNIELNPFQSYSLGSWITSWVNLYALVLPFLLMYSNAVEHITHTTQELRWGRKTHRVKITTSNSNTLISWSCRLCVHNRCRVWWPKRAPHPTVKTFT